MLRSRWCLAALATVALLGGCSNHLATQQASSREAMAAHYLEIVAPFNRASVQFQDAAAQTPVPFHTLHLAALAMADANGEFCADLASTDWPPDVEQTARETAASCLRSEGPLRVFAESSNLQEMVTNVRALGPVLRRQGALTALMRAKLGLPKASRPSSTSI